MQNILYKIRQFMYGRNGVDGLGIFLLILSILIKNIAYFSYNAIPHIISLIISILMIYRLFSKNLVQRRKENQIFMSYFYKVYSFFSKKTTLAKERAQVKATHKIYLCPKCKRKLKVPRHKGKIEISCPCSYKFYKRT